MNLQSASSFTQEPQVQWFFPIHRLAVLTLSLTIICAVSVRAQLRLKTTAPIYIEGESESSTENLDRRIRDYNIAITFNPTSATAHYNRARLLQARGNTDAALVDYNTVIDLKPRYAPAYNNRALIYFSKGRLDEAVADLDRAIQINRRYADAYTNRAVALASKGDVDAAFL
ncbi:MAG TPA: tetratricopeptide repeat protein, partial [Pyrinomonadaceae bacterium]|nr:tetratricopeptide repeat protein [Pyrinomonadaceae bacterium]